jgi:integrase
MADKRVKVWVQHFKDRKSLVLQWVDPDTGRRKSRTAQTDDPKEAEQARADLEYELNHGRYQEASRMAWERFRELFEAEHVAPLRLNTHQVYRATLDAFEEICQPARLRSISERTLSQFAKGLGESKRQKQPSSVRVRLQFLRTALRWAVAQKMLPACPRFPVIKVPKKRPQPIPAESFERLFAKAPDAQMQALLLCGWLAGLRRSEALALERNPTNTVPYLDLAHDRIVLPAEFAKAVEDQWVPLDPVLRQALLALPENGKKFFYFRAYDGHELSENTVGQRVAALAAKAGVKLTMHSLRKGFGCRYAGKVPAQVLQKLTRHADITTTMDYYANVDEAAVQAILGENRNSLRNIQGKPAPVSPSEDDASPCQERQER